MSKPQNIAIVLPNWVGDVVMATPALRALRERFPDAYITHFGKAASLAVLAGGDLADDQMPDRSRQYPPASSFIAQVRRIRRRSFDLAVLLPNSFRSASLFWLGGARQRAGYSRDGRGWMLTHRLLPMRDEDGEFLPVPTIEYYNALARMLGAKADSWQMSLPVAPADQAAAEALLAEAGVDRARPLVMLNPGAAFGPSKLWPAERYAAVADALIERRGAQIIINAAPKERDIAAAVAAAMRHAPAINFAERDNSIGLLKALLRHTSLLVTNDTGARHFAAALGAAVVTIFGSTDPTWARLDYPRERQLHVQVPCGPCQQKVCTQPQGDTFHQCMTAISAEMVLDAAEELLAQPAPEAGR